MWLFMKKIRNSRVTAHQDSPLKMKKEGGEALKIKQQFNNQCFLPHCISQLHKKRTKKTQLKKKKKKRQKKKKVDLTNQRLFTSKMFQREFSLKSTTRPTPPLQEPRFYPITSKETKCRKG